MRTAFPFEPIWLATTRLGTASGRGLIPAPLKSDADAILIKLPQVAIVVRPKAGTISCDSNLVVQTSAAPVVWFRRMQFSLGTSDPNSAAAPECLFYGLGLGVEQMRIFADNRIEILA